MRKTPDWLAVAGAVLAAGKTYDEAAHAARVTPRHLRRVLKELAERHGVARVRPRTRMAG